MTTEQHRQLFLANTLTGELMQVVEKIKLAGTEETKAILKRIQAAINALDADIIEDLD